MNEQNSGQPIGKELYIRQGNLPHWQMGGSVYFVTFRSARGTLPDAALGQTAENTLYDHRRKYHLYLSVVMPDHVHMLMRPLEEKSGIWYNLIFHFEVSQGGEQSTHQSTDAYIRQSMAERKL